MGQSWDVWPRLSRVERDAFVTMLNKINEKRR